VLSGPDLDELAESLLSDEVVAVFPLAWISGQWLELGTADGTTRTVQVSDEAVARDERRVEPPLRRWAAARALRNDLRGLKSCSRVPMAWRRVIVTRCCMACSMPRTCWMRASAVSWWAGHCTAESPGFAGPPWTGCVSSAGPERRCAAPGRTLIGRCALGARPARLNRRRRSCRALRHRSRERTRSCAGWLVVMCGAAILLAAELRRPRNGYRPGGNEDAHCWQVADHGGRAVGLRRPEPRGTRVHRVRRGRVAGQFRLHRRPGEMDCREVERVRRVWSSLAGQ
jgi:hypothetical protein